VPAPSPSAPTLASLELARARERNVLRWMRPLGLVVLAIVAAAAMTTAPRPGLHGAGLAVLLALVGVVAGAAGLAVSLRTRRTSAALHLLPLVILIASSATLVWVQPDGSGFLGGFVAAGAASSRLPRRSAAIVAGLALGALAFADLAGAHRPVTSLLASGLGVIAFSRVGVYSRLLRERTEQAEDLLIELEETREAQLRAATLGERQRLAREMHDVLAHSLSGLVLHLEGARLLAARDAAPPQLADTIERAHHLAHSGLDEARQAIGMLRDEDLPGPERLHALAQQFEADTGVPCSLTVSGTAAELCSQTRLTLYRVAQEALTNIRKHARPCRVELHLAYRPDGTSLTVCDFAAAHPPAAEPGSDSNGSDSNGYGVSGMRERAELLGGTVDAERTPAGFRVALWLPT
jgi:signal transduction histidine kinase